MIEVEPLPKGRYLLGFSGGVDSSALFFLLLERGVEFDIAIVDYGMREQSKEEVEYAQNLAKKYAKKCFHAQAPKFQSNFESQAREFRYRFFSKVIAEFAYEGLLLAHQLDDRVEWMMMQFCKGAGLNTLLGFDFVEVREGFKIYRPLWKVSKKQLYKYCQDQEVKYFEDCSNYADKYTRNQFRGTISSLPISSALGMIRSFDLLMQERDRLYPKVKPCFFGSITSYKREDKERDMHQIDLWLKREGYVLSFAQRKEILKSNFSCEIAKQWVIERDVRRIYLAKKAEAILPKDFKDLMRRLKVPHKIRPNIFLDSKSHEEIKNFFIN